ncbi:MAG: hypothetical protein J2P24_00260 [Streptosporangiales bacterium]|nr:hypothetical protein [Streptosporangiales bacterium]
MTTTQLTTRRAREAAPKWTVRTRDEYGRWTARYVCLSKTEAATRWGRLVATGRVADVIPPHGTKVPTS